MYASRCSRPRPRSPTHSTRTVSFGRENKDCDAPNVPADVTRNCLRWMRGGPAEVAGTAFIERCSRRPTFAGGDTGLPALNSRGLVLELDPRTDPHVPFTVVVRDGRVE